MGKSKIIYNGQTLIDLTGDTVESSKVLSTYTFHDKAGNQQTGECTFDSDTQDATATTSEILANKTAYARGAKLNGGMTNNGAIVIDITSKDAFTVAQGFHDGGGYAKIPKAHADLIVPGNIKNGVEFLGVTGSYSGESTEVPQAKTVDAPLSADLTVTPDTASGYTCLSSVTVRKVSYVEQQNSAGGITVTIG